MIKSFRLRVKEKFHSLYFALIWIIIIGAIAALGGYVVCRFTSNYLISNVYVNEDHRTEREEGFINSLQEFVNKNDLSSNDTAEIGRWARQNRYVYLLIYKDNELFFTSDTIGGESGNGNTGTAPDGALGGGSGITVDYPTREELFEYAEENDLYPVELSDGTLFASIAEFTEYFYYDLANMMSLGVSMVILSAFIINYFRRLIARIKRLDRDVMLVSDGDMSHEIRAGGYDELSRLSVNVENMRNSILENLRREREARNANTELVTAMSHDIRTPLTVLLGYLEIMRESAEGDEVMQSYIGASEKTAMRLKQLSDDMFKYSLAFGSEAEGIKREEYDAELLIGQMLTEHVVLLRESGYEVEENYSGKPLRGKRVLTDAQNLMRIFDNVFSNIYKYADRARSVSITVNCERDRVEIIFRNGIKQDSSDAESNGIGLKTCTRLGRIIAEKFEYGERDGEFTACLVIKLKDEALTLAKSLPTASKEDKI